MLPTPSESLFIDPAFLLTIGIWISAKERSQSARAISQTKAISVVILVKTVLEWDARFDTSAPSTVRTFNSGPWSPRGHGSLESFQRAWHMRLGCSTGCP
eukprot:767434-Hanusia_phi.AAC.4